MSTFAVHDVHRALAALNAIANACDGGDAFVRRTVRLMPAFVRCDSAAIVVCDLDAGCRTLCVDAAGGRRLQSPVDPRSGDADPHCAPVGGPCAIASSLVDPPGVRPPCCGAARPGPVRSAADGHALALPLLASRRVRVSVVLRRRNPPFEPGERALLARLRPQLAALYRLSCAACERRSDDPGRGERDAPPCSDALTRREREVLEWLRAGKTNRDIADLVGASRRTVEKHLEHIYAKLGVETRIAAVMRLERSRPAPR